MCFSDGTDCVGIAEVDLVFRVKELSVVMDLIVCL